jgi:hypothetical protein
MEDPSPLLEGSALSRPDFVRSVSAVFIGGTWKTTRSARHPLSDAVIAALAQPSTRILDVGASAGVTSLELIERLGTQFLRYYVTDAYCKIWGQKTRQGTDFYYPDGRCILRSRAGLLFYGQTRGGLYPFQQIADWMTRKAPALDPARAVGLSLFLPDLIRKAALDERICIEQWSVFQPWFTTPVDLARAANLLNRTYFSDRQIKEALGNLRLAIKPGGNLLLTENRQVEQWSLLLNGPSGFELVDRGNGGSDIESLACERPAAEGWTGGITP